MRHETKDRTESRKRVAAAAVAVCAAFAAACTEAAGGGARPVPGEAMMRRLAEERDVIGIVHWGLNTFTGREWGGGNEDPSLLDAAELDADAIAAACKAGGISGLVVVAKHHDGFCLWPTKTTSYNISATKFRGGCGDYVKEMEQACRRAGLDFGVYVSPWDRNNAGYGREEYVETYAGQLRELASGAYGDIFEFWFDGANGGDGWYGGAKETRTIPPGYYRFGEVIPLMRSLQPNAVVFGGDRRFSDLRWPGNERGELSPDSRATVPSQDGKPYSKDMMNTGSKDGDLFRVCEADFPLRRGWFHRDSENGSAKSPETLMRIYLSSVGNGGVMNIGVAPNKEGRLDENDARALAEFGKLRRELFANEVTNGLFNVLVLRENLANGEQVDGWEFASGGRIVASGSAIGAKRIRIVPGGADAGSGVLRITASGPAPLDVSCRFYLANESLLRRIAGSHDEVRETDTATWMQRGSESAGKSGGGR